MLGAALAASSLPIQPHGGITLTCCNFILRSKMKCGWRQLRSEQPCAFYPRPRRTGTGLERRPVSVSFRHCADRSSGLAPDLCSRGVLPLRTLSDGAGGFLPGVPLECLYTGDHHLRGPSPRFVELINPAQESNAGCSGGVPAGQAGGTGFDGARCCRETTRPASWPIVSGSRWTTDAKAADANGTAFNAARCVVGRAKQ
jgi:hypothetical protein